MQNIVVISALEPQKKKKDRYNVFVDGEYNCSLSADSCVVFGIKSGRQITQEDLQSAVMSDNTQFAFDSAISLLSFKMRTRAELTQKLISRKINEQAIEKAIIKLEKYGYVNDEKYAKEFVESAIQAGRYGMRVIQFKLKQKGINDDLIEKSMECYSSEEEKRMAKKLLVSLKKKYQGEETFKKRRKIFAALVRRGFDYDIINTLLSEDEQD